MLKTNLLVYCLIPFLIFTGCKKEPKQNPNNFTLIERNSYYLDGYNGISVYRDNNTRKLLNGYYVVGDKFKKWEEFNVENGILNGENIVFHDNGNIYTQAPYLNGKLHGEEKIYHMNGALRKLSTYSNGVKYGKIYGYFENGELQYEAKIKDEEIIESTNYNLIGEIESQMFIDDGKKITQYIKGGKVFSEQISSTYDSFEATKFYNEDGSLKMFLQMLVDGEDAYLIERNEEGDEIKRINVKKNPEEFFKYQQYLGEGF